MTGPRVARWALAAVLALAAVEFGVSLFVHRPRLSAEVWDDVAGSLADLPGDVPVLAADPFLGPHLRAHVPAAARPSSVGLADLHGVARLVVVGMGRAWSPAIERLLEGRPAPRVETTAEVGPLRVTHYRFDDGARTRFDLAGAEAPTVTAGGARCRRRRRGFDCGVYGKVEPAFAEVDFEPRRCLALRVPDATTVTIEADVPGTRLRGHLGFTDFNARLRSDAAVTLWIEVDGVAHRAVTVTDAQGFRPFEVPLPGGPDRPTRVRIEVHVPLSGTFEPDGRVQPAPAHVPCLEVRGIDDAEGAAP